MEIRLKVLKTEKDYDQALKDIETLFDAPEGSPEADQLEVLAKLIEDYEDEHYPITPPDPQDAIKFRMEQAGLTQKDLIPYMGSRSRVSEVLSGKRELTLAMIRALNEHLGIPAEVLIREPQEPVPAVLADMDFSHFPLKEMEKQGFFAGFDLKGAKITEKAEEAVRWIVKLAGGFQAVPGIALRKNDGMRLNAKLDRNALLGWSLQALRTARENLSPARFRPEALTDNFFRTLVSLSVAGDGPRLVREYLSKAGITLVAVPHLRHTYLDGAVFLMDGKHPVVAATLRYDRLDNFWFVLLHELGHLKLRHLDAKTPWIADDLDLPHQDSKREKEADHFAEEKLLPPGFDLDKKEKISVVEVEHAAQEYGVHPAIVAGRIRNRKKNYRIFTQFLGNKEVKKYLFAGGSL